MTAHTPGYEVTQDGHIFSVRNWRSAGRRELSREINTDGYFAVRIKLAGKPKRARICVHRLVAMHYLPQRPSLRHEIRHLDGDKSNNAASNLAWGTPKENADDRESHGHTSRGAQHSIAIKRGIALSKTQELCDDLLAALQALLTVWDHGECEAMHPDVAENMARAALAKAGQP